MELNFEWSHGSYPAYMLLVGSLSYSTVFGGLAFLGSRRLGIVKGSFWLGFGIISWIPLLLLGGQHIPGLDQFTPGSYCFGEPNVIHVIALILPPLAVIAGSARRSQESSEAAAP